MLPILAHLQNENRRLRALNAEMLAALRAVYGECIGLSSPALLQVVRAINKAENESGERQL
jgi:hypothetical protein